MEKELTIAVIGLGCRGSMLMKDVLLPMEGIKIGAVCDRYEDRMQEAVKKTEEMNGNTPIMTADYKEILAMPEIDAVVVTTSWMDHIKIAIDAMKAGKYVGCEVGGSHSIQQCWDLVSPIRRPACPAC